MADHLVECKECGAEYPASFRECPECWFEDEPPKVHRMKDFY